MDYFRNLTDEELYKAYEEYLLMKETGVVDETKQPYLSQAAKYSTDSSFILIGMPFILLEEISRRWYRDGVCS